LTCGSPIGRPSDHPAAGRGQRDVTHRLAAHRREPGGAADPGGAGGCDLAVGPSASRRWRRPQIGSLDRRPSVEDRDPGRHHVGQAVGELGQVLARRSTPLALGPQPAIDLLLSRRATSRSTIAG
jgi:hypothetical protein